MKKIIIAIDGYSSCGKSTLAQDLAHELAYIYVDTGAMYRVVTYYFLEHQIDLNNAEAIEKSLEDIHISFTRVNEQNHTFLNGVKVDEQIREMRINDYVSEVAAISSVRKAMVSQQKKMGLHKGLVMDGRDIGTVVFPEAELKIFLTASIEVRSKRRMLEYQSKGINISPEEVSNNLVHRDTIDSTRADSPLRQAVDAKLLDNSYITRKEQLAIALEWAMEKINQ